MPFQIPYKSQPVISKVPVGDTEAGIIEIERLYDLTPPENDYIDALFEEHGIKSEFEEITAIADRIIAKQTESYSEKDVASLVEKITELDPTNVKDIAQLTQIAQEIKAKQKPLDPAEVISKIMANDLTMISENLAEISAWRDRQDEKTPIRNRILATAMLKFRVFKPQAQPQPTPTPATAVTLETWELKHTEKALAEKQLNYKMIAALAEFAENERNHWEKQDNTEIDQVELKKRLNGLEKADKKELTGTISSGD